MSASFVVRHQRHDIMLISHTMYCHNNDYFADTLTGDDRLGRAHRNDSVSQ
jgi:hypothetical protein